MRRLIFISYYFISLFLNFRYFIRSLLKEKNILIQLTKRILWCQWAELNCRPRGYESRALTNWATLTYLVVLLVAEVWIEQTVSRLWALRDTTSLLRDRKRTFENLLSFCFSVLKVLLLNIFWHGYGESNSGCRDENPMS